MSQEEEVSSKRQRISQACENCRKRKIKCDGAQPSCKICLSYDRLCSYDHGNRKRGLQSGYVRSLETILGLLVKELPEGELKLRSLLRNQDIGGKFFIAATAEPLTDIWHQSALREDIQELMKNAGEKMQVDVGCLSSMATTDNAPDQVSAGSDSSETLSDTQVPLVNERSSLLELPRNASDFVEMYFSTTHLSFPIVERRDILYTLHSASEYDDMTVYDKGQRLCLCSIIALTMAYNKIEADMTLLTRLLEGVKSEIAIANDDFEVGHIQAAVLLVLLYLGQGKLAPAWINMGQINRMIVLRASNISHRSDRQPHLLCASQILDVLLSILVDKTADRSLREFDVALDVNAIEEWECWNMTGRITSQSKQSNKLPSRALSIFKLISDLMQHLRNLTASPLNHDAAQNAIINLQQWKASVPAYCQSTEDATETPCTLNLKLFYNLAVIAVAKMTTHPQSFASIVRQSAYSTLHTLRCHIELGGSIFPLLPAFARYAVTCTAITHHCTNDKALLDVTEGLEKIGDELETIWQLQQNGTNSTEEPSHSAPEANLQFSNLLPLSNSLLFADLDVFNDFDTFIDNEFDAVLEGLPLGMNVERGDSQDFAQNLGFLTSDIDPQFLALIENHNHRPP